MHSRKLVTYVAPLSIALSSALYAQDVQDVQDAQDVQELERTGQLAEITVTAERRKASLQSVPIAVSAMDEATLQNRQIAAPQDLATMVPSLKMTYNVTSPTNLSPSLRGSTQQDASAIAAESPFGIYVDDIYVGRMNGNNVQFGDLESIEVLRGPQGTLYGRNTLSGALKFTSRNPGPSPWLNAQVGAGNHEQYRASFSAGGPIADQWAGSLSAVYNHKDGQWYNSALDADSGMEKNLATRAKLRYMPGNGFDAVAWVSFVKSENDAIQMVPGTTPGVPADQHFELDDVVPTLGYYTLATPPLPVSMPNVATLPRGETEQVIAALDASYDFGGTVLRSITGYVSTEDFFTADMSGAGTVIGASDVNADQFTQELQIRGTTLGGRLDYIAGAYYLHESATQDWGWYFFGPASTSRVDIETDSVSLFGQIDYRFTDALAGTFGARWTQDDKRFDASMVQLAPFGGFTDPVSLENTYAEWTPKAALSYTVDPVGFVDSMLLYVSAAKGFKSGGYNGIIIADLSGAQSAYAPETNWTYEVGMKTDLFNRRLRVNAAYFYEKAKDLALNATVIVDGAPSFPVQNAGDATIQGLELEITAALSDKLTVFWNPAFLTGKYTRLDPTSAPAQSVDLYGVAKPRPPQLPWMSFSTGFDYRSDVMLGSIPAQLIAGMDYFKTARYMVMSTNDMEASPYDRLNAYLGLAFGSSWELRLTGRNLQDRETIISGSRPLGGFIVLPPREVVLSLNYML